MFPLFRIIRSHSGASKKFLPVPRRYISGNQSVAARNGSAGLSHTPVMVEQTLEALSPVKGGVYLDMTFGAGGHSQHILNAAPVTLYCLDRDPVAYDKAVQLSKQHEPHVKPLLGRFSELEMLFGEANVQKNSLDGILIDAGCSSMQMDDPLLGFSISQNGPLDMRMDGERFSDQPTAADVLNSLDVPSLAKIFKVYGEEKYAKKVAQALFDAKYLMKSIKTTHELASLIQSTLDRERRVDKLQRPSHVATKVFQALRIFVNNELNELNYAIDMAHSYLKPGGKLVALTFHSLEDRIVKRHFLGIDMDEPISHTVSQKYKNAASWHFACDMGNVFDKKWLPLYKNIVTPTVEEMVANPRSRSAKLRAAMKSSDVADSRPVAEWLAHQPSVPQVPGSNPGLGMDVCDRRSDPALNCRSRSP